MALRIAQNVSSLTAQKFFLDTGQSQKPLTTLTTDYSTKGLTNDPLDPAIGTTVCYSQYAADMDSGKNLITIVKQGDIIDLNGNTYNLFCTEITQEQANNPDLWQVVNVYNSTTNTNTCYKTVNEDLKNIPNVKVKAYSNGDVNLLAGEVVYYNITNNTTKILNKLYKFDPINNTNVIDRHQIVGINLIDTPALDTSFVFEWGDLFFKGIDFNITKYYIGSDSKLTSTPPTTGVIVEMGMGNCDPLFSTNRGIFINMKQPRLL